MGIKIRFENLNAAAKIKLSTWGQPLPKYRAFKIYNEYSKTGTTTDLEALEFGRVQWDKINKQGVKLNSPDAVDLHLGIGKKASKIRVGEHNIPRNHSDVPYKGTNHYSNVSPGPGNTNSSYGATEMSEKYKNNVAAKARKDAYLNNRGKDNLDNVRYSKDSKSAQKMQNEVKQEKIQRKIETRAQFETQLKYALKTSMKAGIVAAITAGAITCGWTIISNYPKFCRGELTDDQYVRLITKETTKAAVVGGSIATVLALVCLMCPPIAPVIAAVSLGSLAIEIPKMTRAFKEVIGDYISTFVIADSYTTIEPAPIQYKLIDTEAMEKSIVALEAQIRHNKTKADLEYEEIKIANKERKQKTSDRFDAILAKYC